MWYLDLLRQRWEEAGFGERDRTDLLLGIYFLACQTKASQEEYFD